MTDNLRDTHFLGFAELLQERLAHDGFDEIGYRSAETKMQILAQSAYDLAYHVTSMIMGDTGNIDLYVNSIPDLTEWTPTEQER